MLLQPVHEISCHSLLLIECISHLLQQEAFCSCHVGSLVKDLGIDDRLHFGIRSSRDRIVGISTVVRPGQPRNCGSIPGRNKGFFCSLKRPDWLWSPPSIPFRGTGSSFPTVKWPRPEADHSPLNAEVKNEWSYTSIPPYTFMAWAGITLRLRDIGGEVAWIHSAQTADFDFCEHGYDPHGYTVHQWYPTLYCPTDAQNVK
jgi:hypothetical protein